MFQLSFYLSIGCWVRMRITLWTKYFTSRGSPNNLQSSSMFLDGPSNGEESLNALRLTRQSTHVILSLWTGHSSPVVCKLIISHHREWDWNLFLFNDDRFASCVPPVLFVVPVHSQIHSFGALCVTSHVAKCILPCWSMLMEQFSMCSRCLISRCVTNLRCWGN